MIDILSAVGFWILAAYCQMRAQLQVRGSIGGQPVDSSGIIESTSVIGAKISLKLLVRSDGQKREWMTIATSVDGASFRFDPSGNSGSEWGERLDSVLEITFASRDVLLLSRLHNLRQAHREIE